jgi:uncharacterized protein DUF5071
VRHDMQARLARRELRHLIPANQADLAAARAAIARGHPAIKPVLHDLLKWIRDDSWPIAKPLFDYFVTLGPTLLPEVDVMLRSRDSSVKAAILRLVADWPADAIRQLSGPLFMIATDGQSWGADLMALRLLARHGIGDREWIAAWLQFKREHHASRIEDIDEIRRMLRTDETA